MRGQFRLYALSKKEQIKCIIFAGGAVNASHHVQTRVGCGNSKVLRPTLITIDFSSANAQSMHRPHGVRQVVDRCSERVAVRRSLEIAVNLLRCTHQRSETDEFRKERSALVE